MTNIALHTEDRRMNKLELNCAVDKFDKVIFERDDESFYVTIKRANGRELAIKLDEESVEQLREFLGVNV